MGNYREYLSEQNGKKDKRKKKRHHRGLILMLVVSLAVYAGISQEKLSYDEVETSIKKGAKKIQTMAVLYTSHNFGGRELPIYSVDTKEKKIAISFDAAWGAEDFDRIMEILDKHKVKATFFMTGNWVNDNPECVKTLVDKGHDLGNHSEHHYDMTTISQEEMKKEIMDVHESVKQLTGYEMELFRPPYGAYDNNVINVAYDCDYFPIEWNVDSLDWKDYGAESIIKTVTEHKDLGPGSIILCHNGAKYTADALDELLTKLKEKGYELVPISELIIKKDYHMDVTGKQIAD
ncbi:MAG: polysaccharide deacetylase family protein [Agathobacter sp.]|nr:polysaccharide deacetylase family protein [Agathobacter sp.]